MEDKILDAIKKAGKPVRPQEIAEAVAFLASLMDAEEAEEAAAVANTLPDLLGLVSQYGLAASVLQRKEKGAS
mgnify:CR=1 FL=1